MKKKKKSRCFCNPRLGYKVCRKKGGRGFTHHKKMKCKKSRIPSLRRKRKKRVSFTTKSGKVVKFMV